MPTLRNASSPPSPSLRARTADALVRLGGRLHRGLVDLALCIDPRLGVPVGGPVRPWVGLLIVALLIGGVAFFGIGTVWAIREALPHRSGRP